MPLCYLLPTQELPHHSDFFRNCLPAKTEKIKSLQIEGASSSFETFENSFNDIKGNSESFSRDGMTLIKWQLIYHSFKKTVTLLQDIDISVCWDIFVKAKLNFKKLRFPLVGNRRRWQWRVATEEHNPFVDHFGPETIWVLQVWCRTQSEHHPKKLMIKLMR